MFRPVFLLLSCMLCGALPVFGDWGDCLWGGSNEETSYSPAYLSGMGGVALAQYQSPMNLGAPPPAIPVQAAPGTQAVNVPQTTIPTITIPAGPVGSVGQPATFSGATLQVPPGTDIVYIMPSSLPSKAEVCVDGIKTIPATEAKIVSAGTPGAIPAALKTITVRRPKVEYQWTYAPITIKTERLVRVVNPRTGRIVQTYCQQESEASMLPWLHRKEVVSYETVEAKVGIPVSLSPSVSSATNTVIQGSNPTAMPYQSQYPDEFWRP